jgi:hypothetical protein
MKSCSTGNMASLWVAPRFIVQPCKPATMTAAKPMTLNLEINSNPPCSFIVISTLISKFFFPHLGPKLEGSEFILFYLNMAYAMFFLGLIGGFFWLV